MAIQWAQQTVIGLKLTISLPESGPRPRVYFPVQEQEAALFVVVSLATDKNFMFGNDFCESWFF